MHRFRTYFQCQYIHVLTQNQRPQPEWHIYFSWWVYTDTPSHLKSIVYLRVHSWWCMFCGFRQMYNNMYLHYKYHSEYFFTLCLPFPTYPCYSNCLTAMPASVHLFRNVDSRAPPQMYGIRICTFTHSQVICPLKLEKCCSTVFFHQMMLEWEARDINLSTIIIVSQIIFIFLIFVL